MSKCGIRILTVLLTALFILSSCSHNDSKGNAAKKSSDDISVAAVNTDKADGSDAETNDNVAEIENVDVKRTFYISTKEELNAVRYGLAESYVLQKDIVFEPSDFEPGGVFCNEGRGWQPIGDEKSPFTGHFNGNGYSVTNLYINIDETVTEPKSIYASLFGWNEGVVENLTVTDCNISARADSADMRCGVYAAAVVANNIGVVQNCCVTGDIRAELISSNEKVFTFAGGICGNSFTVKNCRNEADVNAYAVLSVDKESALASESDNQPYVTLCYAGGISGSTKDIEGCINTGNITSKTSALNSYGLVMDSSYAGGIAGYSGSSEFINCHNSGKVDAVSLGGFSYAGGIIGASNGCNILRCSNSGTVGGVTEAALYDKGARVGGICGSGEASFVDCYNRGTVSAKTVANPDNSYYLAGLTFAGGICVGSFSEMRNCYNVGDLNVESDCEETDVGAIAAQDIPEGSSGLYYLDSYPVGAAREDHSVKCSDAEMRNEATFEGYDFETVWKIDSDSDYPYPVLK